MTMTIMNISNATSAAPTQIPMINDSSREAAGVEVGVAVGGREGEDNSLHVIHVEYM